MPSSNNLLALVLNSLSLVPYKKDNTFWYNTIMKKIITSRPDGVLFFEFPSTITKEIVEQYCDEMDEALSKIDGKFRALADASRIEHIPPIEVAKELGRCMKKNQARKEKSAVYIGSERSTFLKVAVRSTLTMIGRSDIKLFDDLNQALEYVKS